MATRKRTKYLGVYQRESLERTFKGKPDVCLDITYKLDGKKVWEKIGWLSEGYTAKLASDIRADRMQSKRHGKELPKQKKKAPLLSDVWTKYEGWAKLNKSRGGSDDISRYNCYIKDRFANERLDSISPFDLERMKNDLLKKDYSPATVKHCLVLIRQIYNKAATWGVYQGPNPVRGVKMPSIQNQRNRFLSVEEANALLKELKRNPWNKEEYKELKDPQLHDMALVSLHTGARAGELFSLTGSDIDLNHDLIALRDTKNKETRYAPMTKDVQDILRRRMPEDRSALIFTTKDSEQIKEVSNAFGRVVDRLKFNEGVNDPRQRIVFHTLRHTFASWLAIQGTPLYTIARLMGHKSISMSERYSHLSPDHKRDAVNGIEATFNGGKGIEVHTIEKHRE